MSSLSLAQRSAALFVNISTGVVGVNTLSACNVSISGTTVGGGGFGGVGILANVGWTPTTDPPLTLTLPAGGAFTTASSNAQHRWIGNDLGYSFSITGTVTAAATNPAQDYKISVPYPVAVAASYPIDTIVGDLWLSVAYGTNSNFFKAYARTLSTDANSLVVRAITGSTDESLGTLLAGSVITLQGTATYATTTVNQNSGGALAAGLQTVWIPSTAVNWAPTPTPPAFTLPAGAALTYSRCNARYMYVGTDVTYNVDIGGTLTSSPTSAASDYQLSVPYPVALSTYTNPTIVGELWLSVVNGANSNTFKSYARTLTGASSNTVTLRMLTGTADEAFGVLTSGSAFTLQGTLKYTTTVANSNIGVPTSYVAADFKQNVYGDVGLNTGTSNIRGKFDIVHNSNTPALVVDQYGAGDALQVRDGGVVKMVVDANGNVGIGTTNPRELLSVAGTFSKLTEVSLNDVSINLSARAWYIIGRFDGVAGARLELKVLGAEGYNGTDIGGVSYIYASINNNYNLSVANIGGSFTSTGAVPAIQSVKFVQNSTNRFSYFIYAYIGTYTQHTIHPHVTRYGNFTHMNQAASDPGSNSTTVLSATENIFTVNGSVGIGTTNPQTKLEVIGDVQSSYSTINYSKFNTTGFTNRRDGGAFQRFFSFSSSSGILVVSSQGDANYSARLTGNGTWSSFTGAHISMMDGFALSTTKTFPYELGIWKNRTILSGMIACSTGILFNEKKVDEALPMVELCQKQKDTKVYGIFSKALKLEEQMEDIGTTNDIIVTVNSLGEGMIWVIDIQGSLLNGDYICSSKVFGYGERQSETTLQNFTVAKITMDCDFNPKMIAKRKLKKHQIHRTVEETEFLEREEVKVERLIEFDDEQQKYIQKQILKTNIVKEPVYIEYDLYDIYCNIIGTHKVEKKIIKDVIDEDISVDADGNYIWENEIDSNTGLPVIKPEYDVHYITATGNIISKDEYDTAIINGEEVYRAALVSCTYHCG